MSGKPQFPGKHQATVRSYPTGTAESDDNFLDRQFHQSIAALERIHALSPGEFDHLVSTPVHTDADRARRTVRHEAIARRALAAVQQRLLCEEDFNIWSGRRKENGVPVKYQFERAFANAASPRLICRRGALTGIVRAFLRLQDELINTLVEKGENVSTPEQLLEVMREAVQAGILAFEYYADDAQNGWPCFLRSSGRFRGATRLRYLFDRCQEALPLPEHLACVLRADLKQGQDWRARADATPAEPVIGRKSSLLRTLVSRLFSFTRSSE